jgi:hypothetical protein
VSWIFDPSREGCDVIEQLSVFLENKTGRLAELTRALGDAGINMRALMVADTEEFGVVRIICDHPGRAREVLEASGFGVSATSVVAVEIPDVPGGLADVLEALDAQSMSVEYAYCFVEPSGTAAVDVFKVDDLGAVEVLRSSGYRVLESSDLYAGDSA